MARSRIYFILYVRRKGFSNVPEEEILSSSRQRLQLNPDRFGSWRLCRSSRVGLRLAMFNG